MQTAGWFESVKSRLKDIPAGMRSDWEYTNHYELTDPHGEEFWWLMMDDIAPNFNRDVYHPDTECGKRLGLMFDATAAVPALLQMIETQREALEKYRDLIEDEKMRIPASLVFMAARAIEAGQKALNFKPEGVEA